MYDPGRCRFLAEQPLGFVKVEETGSRRGGFCSFLKWWYATRSTQGRPNTASDGLAGVAHTGSSSVVRRGLPLDRLEDVDLTYWRPAGNGWEWGNGIIINNDYGSFPHSLLSTSKTILAYCHPFLRLRNLRCTCENMYWTMTLGSGTHLYGCSNAMKTRPVEAAKFCSKIISSKNPEITLPCRDQSISHCEHAKTCLSDSKKTYWVAHICVLRIWALLRQICTGWKAVMTCREMHQIPASGLRRRWKFPRQGRWWSLFRPCGHQDFEKLIPAQRLGWSWLSIYDGLLIDVGEVGNVEMWLTVDLKVDRDSQETLLGYAGMQRSSKIHRNLEAGFGVTKSRSSEWGSLRNWFPSELQPVCNCATLWGLRSNPPPQGAAGFGLWNTKEPGVFARGYDVFDKTCLDVSNSGLCPIADRSMWEFRFFFLL